MKRQLQFTKWQAFVLLMLSFLTSISFASGQPVFDKIVFFGDSLSDNGNLYTVLNAYMPKSPPYFDGRFSNGKVWSELVAEHYQQDNVSFDDYAVGGETAVLHNPIDGYLPFTITASLYDYLIRTMYADRSNILFIIWVGANDYLPGVANPDELTTNVINNIQYMVDSLIYHGAKHIIVINLPDLSKTPYGQMSGLAEQLENVSKLHNMKLASMIDNLQNTYKSASINLFDVSSLFSNIIESRLIKDTTTSCWTGKYTLTKTDRNSDANVINLRNDFNQYIRTHQLNNPKQRSSISLTKQAQTQFPDYAAKNPALLESFILSKEAEAGVKPCDNPDEHVFWDHVHPTRVMHQMLAKNAIEFIDQHEQNQ